MARNVIDSLLISLGVVVDPKTKGNAKSIDDQLSKIKASAREAQQAIGDFGDSLRQLGGMATAAAAALGTLFTGLAANTIEMADDAKQIERQARLLGLTTDEYQTLRGVVQSYGVDQRDLTDSMAQFSQKLTEAREGNKTAIETFNALGISMDEVRAASPNDMLGLLAEGAERTKGSIEGMTAVSRILGEEAFKQLGPLLVTGRKNIDRLRQSYQKSGAVIEKEQIEKYEQLTTLIAELRQRFRAFRIVVATAFLPALTKVVERLRGFLDRNQDLMKGRLEKWVKIAGEWFEWFANRIELADQWIRRTIGWTRLLLLARDAVVLLATAFLAFKVGGVIYTGLNAAYTTLAAIAALGKSQAVAGTLQLVGREFKTVGAAAGSAGIGFGGAFGILAAGAVVVGALIAGFKTLMLVTEDMNAFFWETKDSLTGLFVDSWAESSGPLGNWARGFLMLRDLGQNNYRTFVALTSIIRDGFALALGMAGDALTALAASPAGQWVISWADSAVQALQPLVAIIDQLSMGFQSLITNFSGFIATGAEGLALDVRARRLAAEGAPAPAMGPALRSAIAPGFNPSRAGQSSTANVTANTTINVTGSNPLATARAVADHQAQSGRAAMAKARGGNR